MDKWYFQLMKNTILKALSLVISLFIFMQAGHASTGVKDLLDEYHYAVTVEWDQKDETFIKAQEDKLLIGLENALATSVNPENVVKEILAQIPDQKLKADITQAFTLFKKDEINANPKDTADYPEGVWTLPPVYRLGKKDKDKYEDIGESDRMTLKFLKP